MEKKPNFFFSKWQIHVPHTRAKQDTLRGYQAFYSRHSAFIEMKMTLHLMTSTIYLVRGKRNALWFWQHFGKRITLAAFDLRIVSTESLILYSFIIKVGMDTLIFYFLIFF